MQRSPRTEASEAQFSLIERNDRGAESCVYLYVSDDDDDLTTYSKTDEGDVVFDLPPKGEGARGS